jgi:hypothetical protein
VFGVVLRLEAVSECLLANNIEHAPKLYDE